MENENFPFLKHEDAQKEIIKNQLDILTENVSKENFNHCTNQLDSKPPWNTVGYKPSLFILVCVSEIFNMELQTEYKLPMYIFYK